MIDFSNPVAGKVSLWFPASTPPPYVAGKLRPLLFTQAAEVGSISRCPPTPPPPPPPPPPHPLRFSVYGPSLSSVADVPLLLGHVRSMPDMGLHYAGVVVWPGGPLEASCAATSCRQSCLQGRAHRQLCTSLVSSRLELRPRP